MIRANELRVGSVLQIENQIIEVGKIEENFISWKYYIKDRSFWNPYISLKDERLKRIELTEEILLKCGFEKIGHLYKIHLLNSLNLMFNSEHNGWYFDIYHNSSKVELQYLNELQNLYFALTGEELEIEL